ncbi:hypothetical protein HUG15_02305 [Salicibibacter cibarius]|uniref:Uncharacterized protein n=2 Tax=Salicibibacter TaxID=2685905 RepID=A0A514LJH5_9BACI|nr:MULTISPECIES: hypothetical protein [Salicibibacter]QDI92016.1 hypothetical protein EPH95_13190 [Salicibibacter halophilus]QQK74550.1 hypothetical protein HUG15_02305 [Salicibibacter cibarius]
MASQRDVKQSKELVQTLLSVKGETYNEWLHAQHQAFISDHQDLIMEGLMHYQDTQEGKTTEQRTEKKASDQRKTDEQPHTSTLKGVEEA